MPTAPSSRIPGPRIAIIGSGPSGCYLAQSLLRGAPNCELTIFDRLPSPFGLIRYGVAADHQHTKAITRQFERLFTAPNVRFAGGVQIGTDIEFAELSAQFDVVVLATGLTLDRPLGIPGEHLPGMFGAGTITRTLNAHPGERPELPSFGPDVVLVGGGNVALDVLRFLVKDRDGYAESDIADHALERYLAQPAERVTVLIRSTPAEIKSDPQMIRELAALPRASYRASSAIPEAAPAADRTNALRLAALAELTDPDRPAHPGPVVTLRFETVPRAVLGDERVEQVELSTDPSPLTASSVITAIGFSREAAGPLSHLLTEDSDSGRLAPGLYRTGWAKRGPRGAIPENRACAKNVADEILTDLAAGLIEISPDRHGFAGLPEQLRNDSVSYSQWAQLEEHERQTAPVGRIRRKLPYHEHMLAIARGDANPPA